MRSLGIVFVLMVSPGFAQSQSSPQREWTFQEIVAQPGKFSSITEPQCSYCLTEHKKGFVKDADPVQAWIRGKHNGGAVPLRHFLSGSRVINDTYGLFFYDPDGGYVSVFEKDYGYEYYGTRGGVMVAQGRDGTLWSALTGEAISGPQTGKKLKRVANLRTTWGAWLLLHPESTAYNLYDGKKYAVNELPTEMTDTAKAFLENADKRLAAQHEVIGVEVGDERKAYALGDEPRRVAMDQLATEPVVIFEVNSPRAAIAFSRRIGDRLLTFAVDGIAPDTAPFMDKETGTRWSLAGRAVDGPLRGNELTWIPSIQCRWYAWVAENPNTALQGIGK